MSNYNIGQYRYSKATEYLTSIINKRYTEGECEYDTIGTMQVQDLKITHKFDGLQTYRLKCTLNGLGNTQKDKVLNIKLKLDTPGVEENKKEQTVKTYTFSPYTTNATIDFVFTPKTGFSKIVFELVRYEEDFINSESKRKLYFDPSSNVTLSSVNNILTEKILGCESIFKLGIQGPTDLIACINGEPIRLGQSGMFEVYKEDFNIYSIGFIIDSDSNSDLDKYFIMDYCY